MTLKNRAPLVPATGRPVRPSGPTPRGYTRPVLVEYGPVAKLTQGTRTVRNDGPMGGHRRMTMTMCL